MTDRKILKAVEFAILMQSGEGIMSKAPVYVVEKFETCRGYGDNLDGLNYILFNEWRKKWMHEDEEEKP